MNTLYIKDNIIKTRSEIVLEIDDRQIINPTHEMLIEEGWIVYEVEQPSEEKIFEEERDNLLLEIINYDSSDNVNIFYVGGLPMWLDKATRAGLLLRFQAEKVFGNTTTTLWYDNMQFPLDLDLAIQMLYGIELYASACYDNTQSHLSNVKQLTTLEDVKNYDYKTGYPEILKFNFE